MDPLRHFRAIADETAADDEASLAQEAARGPGDRLLESLRLSNAWLPAYARLLEDPAYAEADHARRLRKADLHLLWKRLHPSR